MPRIAQYENQQQQTQVASQPRASTASGNAAFEATIRTAQQIGNAVQNTAQAFGDARIRADEAAAEEALIGFEKQQNDFFFNPESGYFNSQGRNAFDGRDGASKSLAELKKSHGEKLSVGAKTLFDRAADARIARGQVDIDRHAAKGLKAWEIATINAQVENSLENASLYWNQPDRFRVEMAAGRQSVIDSAEREGIGAEATAEKLQTFNSNFLRNSIEAATAMSSEEGRGLLDDFGSQLEGPDRVRMEKQIEAKAKAEKTQQDAELAILKGANLVDSFESREDIRAEVNRIEDPELRKRTMSEAMHQFNLRKQGENEAQAQSYEDAENFIVEGGSSAAFRAQNPEAWESLTAKQKKSLESGKPIITDWNTFSDLMLLPKEKLAKINPNDFASQLAPEQRNRLVGAVKSARGEGSARERADNQVGRTRNAQVSSALEGMLGKKSAWKESSRKKADAFYDLLDNEAAHREAQKEAPLTSEEFTKLLSDLTREVTIKRSFATFDFLAPDVEQSVTDLDPAQVDLITKALRDNGVPVTAENIAKAHRQADQ